MFVCSMIVAGCLIAAGDTLVAGPPHLVADSYQFTEGPLWLPDGRWIFSDAAKDAIFVEDGTIYRQPSHNSNGLTLDSQGRLIVCEQALHRITRTEADGTSTVLVQNYEGKPLHGPNDVVIRSDGLVLFTDPKPLRDADPDAVPFSGVYALRPESGELSLLVDDFAYPNGIALSPDERTLYVSDTSKAHIRAFDLDEDGAVSNGRVHCQVRIPDGMAVDRAGRIWSTSSRGIAIFDPSGALLERVEFKGMPTNCAFGGDDGKTLFITARQRIYTVQCAEPGLVPAAGTAPR